MTERLGDPSACFTRRGIRVHVTITGLHTLCGRGVEYSAGLGDVLYGDVCELCRRTYKDTAGRRVADIMQAYITGRVAP